MFISNKTGSVLLSLIWQTGTGFRPRLPRLFKHLQCVKDLKCTWEFCPHVQTAIHETESKQLSLVASQNPIFLLQPTDDIWPKKLFVLAPFYCAKNEKCLFKTRENYYTRLSYFSERFVWVEIYSEDPERYFFQNGELKSVLYMILRNFVQDPRWCSKTHPRF